MKLNNLTPAAGSKGREKRIGRGEGSGHGGTSTRGHKGAQARSGSLGNLRIESELRSHGCTDVSNLAGVLEKVLSV